MIRVVNKRTHTRTTVDFGVHRGTPLGNPYDWRGSPLAQFRCSSRQEAIALFEIWFNKQIVEKNEEVLDALRSIYKMARVGDVNLVCYCVPDDCHAEIIKKFIETHLNK